MTEQLQLDGFCEVDAKVRAVCFSPAAADLDRAVLVVLSVHRGAVNAITSSEIAERVNLAPGEASRRLIAGAVESLVNFHHIPIGGSRVKPYGYFLIESAADLEHALAPLNGEFHALLRRIRALAGKQAVAKLYGQTMLDLEVRQTERRVSPCHWMKLPGGGFAHVRMGNPRRQKCAYCYRPSVALCDGPPEHANRYRKNKSATCDTPMCESHRQTVGPNQDLCPTCIEAGVKPVQGALL